MRVRFVSWLVILGLVLSGCATVFGRAQNEENVSIDSNVPGVKVVCSGRSVMTPGNVSLRQSKDHACTAEKEGYEKKVFRIGTGTTWAGFGYSTALNTAIWGWWTLGIGTGIGWLVDWPSGAMRNLNDTDLYLEMQPQSATSTNAAVDTATEEAAKKPQAESKPKKVKKI